MASLLRSAPEPTEPPSDGSHHANPRPAVLKSPWSHPRLRGRCGVAHRAGLVPRARHDGIRPGVRPGERRLEPYLRRDLGQPALLLGANNSGQVGDGTKTDRLVPVPIGGVLRFRQVSAGFFSTCAVTTDNRAYCWGENDGPARRRATSPHLTPVAVTGGHPVPPVAGHLGPHLRRDLLRRPGLLLG